MLREREKRNIKYMVNWNLKSPWTSLCSSQAICFSAGCLLLLQQEHIPGQTPGTIRRTQFYSSFPPPTGFRSAATHQFSPFNIRFTAFCVIAISFGNWGCAQFLSLLLQRIRHEWLHWFPSPIREHPLTTCSSTGWGHITSVGLCGIQCHRCYSAHQQLQWWGCTTLLVLCLFLYLP